MNPIAIIIPTLNKKLGDSIGKMALATAGCTVQVEVIVVHDAKREGFTKTVNRGITLASANADICLLNDDVTWFQWEWLEILRRVLYSNKSYGMTGPSGDCGAIPIRDGLLGDFGILEVGHLSFWCVLIKRAALNKVSPGGLLDEEFIHYNSDSWCCVIMRRAGWKLIWVKSIFLKHTKHGSGKIAKWRDHDIKVYRGRRRRQ